MVVRQAKKSPVWGTPQPGFWSVTDAVGAGRKVQNYAERLAAIEVAISRSPAGIAFRAAAGSSL